jgi:hypothetical protein
MTEQVTFQLRRGLSTGATGWTEVNPTLSAGEPGFELDTTTLKIGNGTTSWNNSENLRFGTEVAIGNQAGQTGQTQNSIAIGNRAGQTDQGISKAGLAGFSIAIGIAAGNSLQGEQSIAIGRRAAEDNQGQQSIAIGTYAGYRNQGAYSIAIGSLAGNIDNYVGLTYQADNTIILNASGSGLVGVSGQTGSCYIKPIRDVGPSLPIGTKSLGYDPVTGEMFYYG